MNEQDEQVIEIDPAEHKSEKLSTEAKKKNMAFATKANAFRFDNISPELRAQYVAKRKETYSRRKKARKTMQLLTLEMLENGVLNGKAREMLEALGMDGDDATYQAAIIAAQIVKALKGDTNAFIVLRDTSGQKPIEQIQTLDPPKILDDVIEMQLDSEEEDDEETELIDDEQDFD